MLYSNKGGFMKTIRLDNNIHRDLKKLALELDKTLQELIHEILLDRVLKELKTESVDSLYSQIGKEK